MGAVGEQLLLGGRAAGARYREAGEPALGRPREKSQRAGDIGEGPLPSQAVQPAPVQPQPALQAPPAGVVALQSEHPALGDLGLRDQGLVPDGVEVAVESLESNSALPGALLALHQLQPPLIAVGEECRPRRAILKFGVAVGGRAGGEPNLLDGAEVQVSAGPRVHPALA